MTLEYMMLQAYNKGFKEGYEEGLEIVRKERMLDLVVNVQRNLDVSFEEALVMLDIPEDEFSIYREMLKEKSDANG